MKQQSILHPSLSSYLEEEGPASFSDAEKTQDDFEKEVLQRIDEFVRTHRDQMSACLLTYQGKALFLMAQNTPHNSQLNDDLTDLEITISQDGWRLWASETPANDLEEWSEIVDAHLHEPPEEWEDDAGETIDPAFAHFDILEGLQRKFDRESKHRR